MPLAASVLIGPAEMALTRMPSGPRSAARYLTLRLQRRLGDAHHVVMRDDLLGAVIGQRQERAAAGSSSPARAARRRRSCRPRCSWSSGNCPSTCRRTSRAARSCRKSRSRGRRSRARPSAPSAASKVWSSAFMSRDVAIDQQVGPELGRERAHALLQRLALVGESELGALLAERRARCPRPASGRWRGP